MSAANDAFCLSTKDASRELGCQQWHVQRVCEIGKFPEPPRIGRQRAFRRSDLPALRKALQEVGYLPAKQG